MILLSTLTHSHPAAHLQHDVRRLLTIHRTAIKQVALVSASTVVTFAVLNGGLWLAAHGRVAPFTRVNGISYGMARREVATSTLAARHAKEVIALRVQGEAAQLNAITAGVQILPEETLAAQSGGFWQSLPLVRAVHNLLTDKQPVYAINTARLVENLKPFVATEYLAPVDAQVVIPRVTSEPVTITPDTMGHSLTAEIAGEQVAYSIENNNFVVPITPQVLAAKWDSQDMAAFLPQIEAARRLKVAIQTGSDQEITVADESLQNLLRVSTLEDKLAVTLDKAGLVALLNQQGSAFHEAPIAARVSLRDGIEVSRTNGTPGRILDADKTADLITTAFQNGVLATEAVFKQLDPNVIYSRSYSNSDIGLYKLIEDFAKSHAGLYKVAAVELDGPGNRSAFYAADDQIMPASTYKVFAAYATLYKIEHEGWTFTDATSSGSLEYCFRQMILVSDNDCAVAIKDKYGWKEMDSFLADKGFTNTKLNNYSGGYMKSTARDEMKLLTGLYNNELVSQANRDYLFDLMAKQIYRQGIPAGSNGSMVADKVGFWASWYHDMGIVYGPKSTYALVILTEGANGFTNIRLLSDQIYDFYNQ